MPHAQSWDETTVIIQIDGSRSVAIRYETTIQDGMVYATLNKEDLEGIEDKREQIIFEAAAKAEEFTRTLIARDLRALQESLKSEAVKRLAKIGWIETTLAGFEITKEGKEELENYADR